MDDAMKKQQAQKMYNIFCQALDASDWKYKEKEADMIIECGAQGDDLPMDLVINVNEKLQTVTVFSQLPYSIAEDKRIDIAAAISVINNQLVHGCFDYNIANGKIYFRIVSSFQNFLLSQESCTYMMFCTCNTVDEYNDKFLMLGKGMLSLEDFIKAENE